MALKPLAYPEVKRRHESTGFIEIGTKGSHLIIYPVNRKRDKVVIVTHDREVVVGTMRSILRQAGLSPDEIEAL